MENNKVEGEPDSNCVATSENVEKRELRSSNIKQPEINAANEEEEEEVMPQPKQLTAKERIKEALNDLFKQAIVGRSWKNKE